MVVSFHIRSLELLLRHENHRVDPQRQYRSITKPTGSQQNLRFVFKHYIHHLSGPQVTTTHLPYQDDVVLSRLLMISREQEGVAVEVDYCRPQELDKIQSTWNLSGMGT